MKDLLEPCKLYFDKLENKVIDESTKFFDSLVKESKMNVEKNKAASLKYEKEVECLNNAKKQLKKYNSIKVILIVLTIIFGLARTIFLIQQIISGFDIYYVLIPVYVVLLGLSIFFIIYLSKNNREKIISFKDLENKHLIKSKELLDECNRLISPLLSLFDYSDPDVIFQKVTPLVQLDTIFDKEKLAYIDSLTSCGVENTNIKSSLVFIKSGSINDVPFIILKFLNHYMGTKTYFGSRVVSYTVTYRDSEGRSRTTTRFETLTASVTKPYPEYYYSENLHFASNIASNLSFSRRPFYLKKINDEKAYQKYIDKNMKQILKDNSKSKTFVEINNDEFEVLFHAIDRNNEQEFRLLFTPLGQKSVVSLIKDSPYGDDFTYTKDKKLNTIFASHALLSDRSCDPKNYFSYSYEICKDNFIKYNTEYFKSIYFEAAPILSIPIFQQYRKERFNYDSKLYPYNYSRLDHEVIANLFSQNIDSSATKTIRKTKYEKSINSWDIFNIESHGFDEHSKVDMIPKVAGNGKTYLVPVHYKEYTPNITRHKVAALKTSEKTKDIKNKYFSGDLFSRYTKYAKNKSYSYSKNKVYFLIDKYDSNIFN